MRKIAPKREKVSTSQGRNRKIKTRKIGPLGRPLAFFTQGHPTEERNSTQTDIQEGGAMHKAEMRMTVQRRKNTPRGKKGRTAQGLSR